jgi:hypothetical protein
VVVYILWRLYGGARGQLGVFRTCGTASSQLSQSKPSGQSADFFTARAGNRRFWRLSALRAHTKAP